MKQVTVIMLNDYPLETISAAFTDKEIEQYCRRKEKKLQDRANKEVGTMAPKIYVRGYKVPYIE